jgi:hypothetical protein
MHKLRANGRIARAAKQMRSDLEKTIIQFLGQQVDQELRRILVSHVTSLCKQDSNNPPVCIQGFTSSTEFVQCHSLVKSCL